MFIPIPFLFLLGGTLFLAGWLTTTHISPWVSWHAELPFFAVIFLAVWCWLWRGAQVFRPPQLQLPWVVSPFLLLVFITVVQYLLGVIIELGTAVVVVLYLALMGMTIAIASSVPDMGSGQISLKSPGMADVLAFTILIGAVLSVGIALAQALQVWESSSWIVRMPVIRRPGGNLGQPNHLSTILIMALAAMIYLNAMRLLGTSASLVVGGFLGLGLAVTESRTGLVCLVALLLWWGWHYQHFFKKTGSAGMAACVALYVPAMIWWPKIFLIQSGMDQMEAVSRLDLADTGGDRLLVWPQLLVAIAERPWWGWGMRQTALAHDSVVLAFDRSLPLTYSHNLLIDLMLWVGIPITLVLVGLAVYWLWTRLRLIRSLHAWLGMSLLLPLAIHSMLEFPFAYAYLVVPAMLGVGLVEGATGARRFIIPMPVTAGAIVLLSVLGIWSVVDYLKLEQRLQIARFEMLRIGSADPEDTKESAKLLTQLDVMVSSARLPIREGMSPAELSLLRRAAQAYPWSGTRFRYARALALNDQMLAASDELAKLCAQHGERLTSRLWSQLDSELARLQPVGPRISPPKCGRVS